MRIAISTDAGTVSAHFGRCPTFTIVDIENGRILRKEEVANPGHQPGFLPQFLREKGVSCIIAGGMGQRAVQLFAQEGIERIVGISGTIDDVCRCQITRLHLVKNNLCVHDPDLFQNQRISMTRQFILQKRQIKPEHIKSAQITVFKKRRYLRRK